MVNKDRIIRLYCVFCGTEFYRYRKPGEITHEGNRKGIRQSNAIACSRKCSKDYITLKQYGEDSRK